jgi:outer membrane lipoprotein carrier protein
MKVRNWVENIGMILILALNLNGAAEEQKIMDRVEKAVRNANTLSISFQEKFIWKMTGEENTLSGTLLMEGDDRFRIETEDQVLVSDGKTLWTYSRPANRVLIDKLAETEEALLPRQLLLQYTRGYSAARLPDENILGVPCTVLLFTDTEGTSYYSKWEIWIDPDTFLPKQLMQEDLSGNQNIYLLETIEPGVKIDPARFQFEIPEGAEVIEM